MPANRCPASFLRIIGSSPFTFKWRAHHLKVVPAKRSNKEEESSAEGVEGSCSTKGNTEEAHRCRTQGQEHVSQGLGGVREAARRDKKQKFTALLHHVTTDLLRDSYFSLKRKAAPGVDGITWEQYGEG